MMAAELKNQPQWDWMRPGVATIQANATLEEAMAKMKALSVHHLVVLYGDNYAGMLDARDCAGIWDPDKEVGQLMRSDLPLIDEDTEVREVVQLVLARGVTALAIMKDGRLQGIVTTGDLVRLLEAQLGDPEKELPHLIEQGESFLALPFVQSFSRLLGNAGV